MTNQNSNVDYNYKDILLQPKCSELKSRSDADTRVKFGKHTFNLPICIANMKTVIDEELAAWCAKQGYFYVMHRFNVDALLFIQNMRTLGLITSISLGVNEDSYQLIDEIIEKNLCPDYITIDIAHGHCEKMKNILKYINDSKLRLPNTFNPFVIAGNVCTSEALRTLESWGADAVKVGIGPGCFVAGTKIYTKSGLKNIEDIVIDDEVFTHFGRLQKVISTLKREEYEELININGIKSTKNHEYYVLHKKHEEIVNDENIHDYAEWVAAENLTKEYFLLKCL